MDVIVDGDEQTLQAILGELLFSLCLLFISCEYVLHFFLPACQTRYAAKRSFYFFFFFCFILYQLRLYKNWCEMTLAASSFERVYVCVVYVCMPRNGIASF